MSIREQRMLPLPLNFRTNNTIVECLFGIGYDPSVDDYKTVVVPFKFHPFKSPGDIPRVEIFTLKSKSNL